MTHRFTRDTSKLQDGADERMQQQLALYKTPASIRELKIVPLILSIVPERRPLLIRPNKVAPFIVPNMASTDNKMYKYFEAPALIAYPRGTTFNQPDGNDLPPKFIGTDIKTLNIQDNRYPYVTNCHNTGDPADYHLPNQYLNPPITGGANPSNNYIGATRLGNANVTNYEGKFYPVLFSYQPPRPYPATAQWSEAGVPNPFGYNGGSGSTGSNITSSDLGQQVDASAYTLIPDMMGTEHKIDLTPFMAMLTDTKVSNDKIVYEFNLSAVQVSSDGRVLASSRLISNGAKKMDQYLKNRIEPEEDSPDLNDAILYTQSGFGYPDCFVPRPIVAQPIHVGIKEYSSPNNPYQWVSNSNEGYSLDKGSGSVIEFGRLPYSELTVQIGHYLSKPVGDINAVENECNRAGWYDLNNEYFSTNKFGGTTAPVLKNQQIDRLELRFEVKIISLF